MFSNFSRSSVALVALTALAASATVIAYETLDQMAAHAPVIVRGRVMRTVAGYDAEKRRIWTWAELSVTESIKGKTGSMVLIKQLGGEVDGRGQAVAGVARFTEGEDVVVLLERAPDEAGTFLVYGMSAGKIVLSKIQGVMAASRDTSGLSFAATGGMKVERIPTFELLGTPDELIARLRKAGGVK